MLTTDFDSQQVVERANIINAIHRFLLSVDTRDYAAMRTCLTDEINFDYSALFGTSMPSKADELVERVRADHTELRSVQHSVTNHYVTIDDAAAQCCVNFQAQHFLPNDQGSNLWTLGGRYVYHLVRTQAGWKIQGCVISVSWTEGNLYIFDLARQQAN